MRHLWMVVYLFSTINHVALEALHNHFKSQPSDIVHSVSRHNRVLHWVTINDYFLITSPDEPDDLIENHSIDVFEYIKFQELVQSAGGKLSVTMHHDSDSGTLTIKYNEVIKVV